MGKCALNLNVLRRQENHVHRKDHLSFVNENEIVRKIEPIINSTYFKFINEIKLLWDNCSHSKLNLHGGGNESWPSAAIRWWEGVKQYLMAGGPNNGINGGVGDGQSLIRHGYPLPPMHRWELCAGQQHTNMCKDLSNSKNLVFNMKKPVNDVVDLTPLLNRSDMSGMRASLVDLRHQKLVSTSEGVNHNVYQELLRQRTFFWWKIHLSDRSTPPGPPSVCWQNSGLHQISHHISWTWIRWIWICCFFSIWPVLKVKVQAMPHANLTTLCHPSPWNRTG